MNDLLFDPDWLRTSAVLARQEQRHRAKDFIGWLQQSIHFHTQLVSRADFSDLSNILQNLMLQIRIGSFRTHDLPSVRTTVMEEHEAYLKLIADGSHKGFTKWSDVIQEHILKSFAIAALVSVAEDPTKAISKFRESPIWQTTCLLAVANPIVRGDEAINNK